METSVEIKIIEDTDTTIFIFNGELDETNSDKTFKNIYQDLEKYKGKKIIFDFEELIYINSKTIGYLVDIYTNIEEEEGEMYIRNCKGAIKDTLNFTGIDTIIPYID